jgi:ABC-type multidrug transport system ATPase subunit
LYLQVNNLIKALGLTECANTVVGDASLKGISGGQKRRVTMGEGMMSPRPIKFMDAISNGLDAATTFDIVQGCKAVTKNLGLTTLVSMLQVITISCAFLHRHCATLRLFIMYVLGSFG